MEIITKQVEMGVTDDIRPGYYSFRFLTACSLTIIRVTKDEKGLAFFKGLLL
jgi:hypothetical protein